MLIIKEHAAFLLSYHARNAPDALLQFPDLPKVLLTTLESARLDPAMRCCVTCVLPLPSKCLSRLPPSLPGILQILCQQDPAFLDRLAEAKSSKGMSSLPLLLAVFETSNDEWTLLPLIKVLAALSAIEQVLLCDDLSEQSMDALQTVNGNLDLIKDSSSMEKMVRLLRHSSRDDLKAEIAQLLQRFLSVVPVYHSLSRIHISLSTHFRASTSMQDAHLTTYQALAGMVSPEPGQNALYQWGYLSEANLDG